MRRNPWLWALLLVVGLVLLWPRLPDSAAPILMPPSPGGTFPSTTPEARRSPDAQGLPTEAHDTIARIQRGGPFAHRQDGSVFQNRERRLPQQPRGYYREYTVETPGLSHRGARRIVTGGQPPSVWYYTEDHYDSFRRIEVNP